jgi:predicted ThiF/HesA family dinucleotide-utilizing enzyme
MSYEQRISRNIGLLTEAEQQKISTSKIAVLGTGGIGGPLALNLCYAGVQNFVLADFDTVELTNLNRQPYTQDHIGKYKVDALAENLMKIDSQCTIEKFYKINETNVHEVLKDVVIIVLSLDGPAGSILISRTARELGIPVVEAWATPFVFTRWFTSDSIAYESCYEMGTESMTFAEMESDSGFAKRMYRKYVDFVFGIPGIKEHYQTDREVYEKFLRMEISARSFAPLVWQNSIYLSIEVIYAGLLGKKEMIIAPKVRAFDPFTMQIVEV